MHLCIEELTLSSLNEKRVVDRTNSRLCFALPLEEYEAMSFSLSYFEQKLALSHFVSMYLQHSITVTPIKETAVRSSNDKDDS